MQVVNWKADVLSEAACIHQLKRWLIAGTMILPTDVAGRFQHVHGIGCRELGPVLPNEPDLQEYPDFDPSDVITY